MPFADNDEILPLLPGIYSNTNPNLELEEPPPAYVSSSSHEVRLDVLPPYASSSREAEEGGLPPYITPSHYQYFSLAARNQATLCNMRMQPVRKPKTSSPRRPPAKHKTGVYINGSRAWKKPAKRRGCPCCCGMPHMPWIAVFLLFFAIIIIPGLVIGLPLGLPHHSSGKSNGSGWADYDSQS